jgi:hypothetical protein
MLKINLVPFEELEDKHWYLPDLIIYLILGSVSWWAFTSYVDSFNLAIAQTQTQIDETTHSLESLQPSLTRYNSLLAESQTLQEQLLSLRHVTTAKIPRYRPVILMEMLQKLKPEGLWFKALAEKTASGTLSISGESYDTLLVAQFIAALNAHRSSGAIATAPEHGIYFSRVNLQQLSDQSVAKVDSSSAAPAASLTQRAAIQYEISLNYKEQQQASGIVPPPS